MNETEQKQPKSPDEIVEHNSSTAVVTAVMKRIFIHLFEPLSEKISLVGVLRAHRLREIAECLRFREVQSGGLPVGQYPREHGILREIVEGTAGEGVEGH